MTHKVSSYSHSAQTPEVFITINKNRLKSYSNVMQGLAVYLKNNDEFEIEFDNITSETWLARIKINGKWSSESGLVLRPGERVYLDTPDLDEEDKQKFRFSTYEVEKGREGLTKDNGLVEVFFYKKEVKFPKIIIEDDPIIIKRKPRILWDDYWETRRFWPDWTYKSNYPYTTSGTTSDRTKINYDKSYYSSQNISVQSMDFVANYQTQESHNFVSDQSAEYEETGIVDKGSDSGAKFDETVDNFESTYTKMIIFQLFPISKKPKTIQDVKEYCSECGRRRRKTENFCPSCGNKF